MGNHSHDSHYDRKQNYKRKDMDKFERKRRINFKQKKNHIRQQENDE